MEDHVQIFTNIYEKCVWGNNNNPNYKGTSGDGSTIELNINTYIPVLKNFIRDKNISTVVDLGCGDFRCGRHIYDYLDVTYYGYDAYDKVIENNKASHSESKYNFTHLDFFNNRDQIISADLCIMKDVLQHWNLANIYTLLDYFTETGKFKYILICNCATHPQHNADCPTGSGRHLACDFYPLRKYEPAKIYKYSTKEVSVISVDALRDIRKRIIVSLTTIPARIENLNQTIQSLLNQTFKPDHIIINVPQKYKRFYYFKMTDYYLGLLKKIEALAPGVVIVNFCEDYGPATKIIPTLNHELVNDDTKIIFLDDDRIYVPELIRTLYNQSILYPDYCITVALWNLENISPTLYYSKKHSPPVHEYQKPGFGDIFLACCGVVITRSMLDNHNITKHHEQFPSLIKADNIFLSAILHQNKIPIYSCSVLYDQPRSINTSIMALSAENNNKDFLNCISYLKNELAIWQ